MKNVDFSESLQDIEVCCRFDGNEKGQKKQKNRTLANRTLAGVSEKKRKLRGEEEGMRSTRKTRKRG